MRRLATRLTIALLLVLSCAGMVAQAGSVPHVHQAYDPGLYNAEHDLTLLAAMAASALLSDGAPVRGPDAVVGAMPPLVPERPAIRSAHASDSRAPPTA
jgi:hypothetical protein